MNDLEKAIKACNEEIQFYKKELKEPHMNAYLPPEEDYIRGHSEAYCQCQDKIKIFEFIINVLLKKQLAEQRNELDEDWCLTCHRWLG